MSRPDLVVSTLAAKGPCSVLRLSALTGLTTVQATNAAREAVRQGRVVKAGDLYRVVTP